MLFQNFKCGDEWTPNSPYTLSLEYLEWPMETRASTLLRSLTPGLLLLVEAGNLELGDSLMQKTLTEVWRC